MLIENQIDALLSKKFLTSKVNYLIVLHLRDLECFLTEHVQQITAEQGKFSYRTLNCMTRSRRLGVFNIYKTAC
jgi:hypothetical protein